MEKLTVDSHPSLRHGGLVTTFPRPLGETPSPSWLTELLQLEADTPLKRDEDARLKIRDLLRHGGYKPTGRGKPASEYLVRAAGEGSLTPINLAVDACNVVSLHSSLPISVVDVDRAVPPLRIGIAGEGDFYVFNNSGQRIDLKGLLCVHDSLGPCANAVKDSQRTKTTEDTRRTLSIIWACVGLEERLERAVGWYSQLLEGAGCTTEIL